MRHQPKVADADESRRKHVQQESAQELVDRQCHQTLLVLVSGIAPAKSDHTIGKGDESMVGNRYAMSVLAEIAQRVMREFLVPGVQDGEEPDLRAEALGIAGDFEQRLGAGPE